MLWATFLSEKVCVYLQPLLRRQCTPEATEFGEITQSKGHYAVQGHSRSPILVPMESSCTTSTSY